MVDLNRRLSTDSHCQSLSAKTDQSARTVYNGLRRIEGCSELQLGGNVDARRHQAAPDVRHNDAGSYSIYCLCPSKWKTTTSLFITFFSSSSSSSSSSCCCPYYYYLTIPYSQGGTIKLFVRLLHITKDDKERRHLMNEMTETVIQFFFTHKVLIEKFNWIFACLVIRSFDGWNRRNLWSPRQQLL